MRICIAGVLAIAGFTAEKPVKMEDLPPPVQNTVRDQSKGATLRGLSQEIENGKVQYEAELTVAGHRRDVLIDANGAVVEIEEAVTLASVPAPVRNAFAKRARGGKIESIESVTVDHRVTAYEAKIRTARRVSEVRLSPQGLALR